MSKNCSLCVHFIVGEDVEGFRLKIVRVRTIVCVSWIFSYYFLSKSVHHFSLKFFE